MSPRSLWPFTLCLIAVVCLVALSDPRRWADAAPTPALPDASLSLAVTASQPTTETVASILRVPIKPVYDPGDLITVTVRVENATNVVGAELKWQFDASAFRVVDMDPVRPEVQLTPGSIFQPPAYAGPNGWQADNTAGKIRFAAARLNPLPPFSGDGTVVVITFQAKNPCGSTLLEITPDTFTLANAANPTLPFTATGPLLLSAYPYCAYLPDIMRGYGGE